MIKQNRGLALKFAICLLAIMVTNLVSFGIVMGNFGECAFSECEGKGISIARDISIKLYIIKGARYFLKSFSYMNLFLKKVERSELNGINYRELKYILNRVIRKMEKANDTYFNLKQKADHTPYNQAFINQLLSFDYVGFQYENGLNMTIFKDVELFLSKGDVKGFFSRFLANSEEILNKLYIIKESVDVERFPEISTLWRVNQEYSEAILFAQYGSEICYAISGTTNNDCE